MKLSFVFAFALLLLAQGAFAQTTTTTTSTSTSTSTTLIFAITPTVTCAASSKVVSVGNTSSNRLGYTAPKPYPSRKLITFFNTHATDAVYLCRTPICTSSVGFLLPAKSSFMDANYKGVYSCLRSGSNDIPLSVVED